LADGILADASAVALERVAERRATFSRANVVAGGEGSLGSRSVVRYTETVTNPFVESMASNFDTALRLMEAAVTDCPDKLWETDLWPNEAPTGPTPHGGLHGSAPWFLAYHALLTLDYDLTAEFEPWEPPQPFDENSYAFPNRMFTKAELLGYLDYCRARVRRTLEGLTEAEAARPLPDAHRYHGMLYGVIVGGMPLHLIEHASQIRQFLTAAGVKVQPMPGDRGYTSEGS
jgi:hypothetical protein